MALEHPRLLAASLTVALFTGVSCSSNSATAPQPEPQPAAGTGTGTGAQDPAREALDQQRRDALVAKYLEVGNRLRGEGKLDAALHELMKAKEMQPGNAEVLSLISAIRAEQGSPAGGAVSFHEEQQRLRTIGEERRRASVLEDLQNARSKMGEMDFSGAGDDLARALLTIQVAPPQEWGDLPAQVAALKAEADLKHADQVRRRQEEDSAELARRLAEQRRANQARLRAQVDTLLQEAQVAFVNRRFQYAQDLSLKALGYEPGNAVALEMHNASLKAAREGMSDSYYLEKSREMRNMLEAMEELKIPQTRILEMDAETWEKALRRSRLAVQADPASAEDQAVWAKVEKEQVGKLRLTEENGAYTDVVKNLTVITGVPILITPGAREVISGESLTMVIELVNSISLKNFLDHMVSRSTNLAWTVRNSVVVIGNKSEASGTMEPKTYDVRDLTFKRTQFLPPRMRQIPNGDEGDTSRTGSESEDKIAFVDINELVTQLKEATDLTYWDGDGPEVRPEDNGYLVITCSPQMHMEVAARLADMRRFATSVVTIDSKFMTVSSNFLREVGVDFRGLGGAGNKGTIAPLDDVTNGLDDNSGRGLDNGGTGDPAANPLSGAFYNDGNDGDVRARTENFFAQDLGRALTSKGGATFGFTLLDDTEVNMILRAIEKRENAELMNSQLLTVQDNERGHVAVINQTAFVRDFDVEVAQASFIADPQVDTIQDGIVLDVKPIIQQDRKYIILDLQPTVAELARPIPTFTTSLAGSTLPVTLQLPVMTVTSFATTAKVPDGGSVLLGGLRQVYQVERKATVPFFSDLPLLSFFFKQEGSSDESSSLMVMVRAYMTDVRDLLEGK